ncbi:MAG: HipA domain-containing protein [Proteobacteria bacterium]|nr:HipA domain-containing protein [Pseudomonadota bacterium]
MNYPERDLPPRVADRTDHHYLAYLTRRDADSRGDLIVGKESLERYFAELRTRRPILGTERNTRYPELAGLAIAGELPGSTAHGEHSKFTALIARDSGPEHVIVKFSPPRSTAVGRRWSDLLVAEHLAHQHLGDPGISTCASRILEAADQTFLEVTHFDRIGAEGRRWVVSLLCVDATCYGRLDRWPNAAARLHADGLLDGSDADRIRLLEAFGLRIANTDRYFRNLALFDRYEGRFTLAPVYDMLPMLYAPQNEQLVTREFEAPSPTAETLRPWSRARELPLAYWALVANNPRVSEHFRSVCRMAGEALTMGTRAHCADLIPSFTLSGVGVRTFCPFDALACHCTDFRPID